MDSSTVVPAVATKQVGKMKTKLNSGLNQVRAQRSGVNSNNELSIESSLDGSQLQNTKSLSMFFNSSKSDTEKNMKLPNINFSPSSNVKPLIEKKDSDFLMPSVLLGTKSEHVEAQKNISIKTGAYEAIKSSPTTFSSGTKFYNATKKHINFSH